ncbi:EDSAP-1 family PEP-CTERM protein [Roseateles sp. DC23W]|uniref:EDSAP-1 family PEP-CTERM protein n=1 Tax=Pelomonas dachongensis TaxID=3299029 RepID=A0ABW7EWK1_9BURK
MITTSRFSLIAAGVALACGLGSTAARADAVAQAILDVTNFHFALGNGSNVRAADGSLAPRLNLATLKGTTTADATVSLNGANAAGSDSQNDPLAIAGASATTSLGNAGSYVPGAPLAGAPVATYGASTADQFGNSLFGVSDALTDGVVSLKPAGNGSTQSNVNFNAEFTITVQDGTSIEIAFDAESYLRAYLSASGIGSPTARASTTWSITITSVATNDDVFAWVPDGLGGNGGAGSAIFGGVEYYDPFSLNQNATALSPASSKVRTNAKQAFQAETNALVGGTYTVVLSQTAVSDAFLKLPEPASLGLLGAALFGAGVASRRRSKK